MRTQELHRELFAAQSAGETETLLLPYGVAPEVSNHCGATRVRKVGPFYEPDPQGAWAVIVPVVDFGELVDLLAFHPREPARWRLRRGALGMLGADALTDQLLGEPLFVFRNVLSWLQASTAGVVILNWTQAFAYLACAPHGLIAEDLQHRAELNYRFQKTVTATLPKIQVHKSMAVA